MTNKEAYEILDRYKKCSDAVCPPVSCDECPYRVTSKQFDEAFQVALEALQAQEEKDNCSEEPNNSEQKRVFKRLVRNKEAYYSIIWEENGEENEGYSSYNLDVISDYLKEHFIQEPKQSDSGFTTRINPEIMHDRTTDDLIMRDLTRAITAGILSTSTKDVYSCGMRNGMRWCRSLIDDKRPEFEDASQYVPEIKELSSVQPESCGDVVSRNAIIRALNTMDRYVSDELTLCDTDRKFPKNEVFIVDDVYEEIAENLPSVQPEQNDAEFWRKRSDEYEKMFFDLYWRMMNGVKFESMQFDKNGITLKMKESSREDNT